MHKTSHGAIMLALNPSDPTTVDDLLAFHRSHFGDARMEGDEGGEGGGEGEGGDPPEAGQQSKAPWEKRGEEFDAEKAKTYIASLTSERDREAAARKAAEAKVKEHDDSKLSETDKLTRELEQQRTTAADKARTVDRYEVAEEVGLPLTWARRLVGDDRDALLADAKAMKADLDEKSKPGTPKPDPSQGGGGGGKAASSVSAAKEEYLERRRKQR